MTNQPQEFLLSEFYRVFDKCERLESGNNEKWGIIYKNKSCLEDLLQHYPAKNAAFALLQLALLFADLDTYEANEELDNSTFLDRARKVLYSIRCFIEENTAEEVRTDILENYMSSKHNPHWKIEEENAA